MDYLPIIAIVAVIVIIIIISKYRPDGFQTQSGSSNIPVDDGLCSTLKGLKSSLQDKLAQAGSTNKVLSDALIKALDAVKLQLTNQGC